MRNGLLNRQIPGVFGQVINDTKNTLGVSKEALLLLKKIRRGRSSIGEIDWFKTGNGDQFCFGWIGGPYALIDPQNAEASSTYAIGDFVDIPNDVPQAAMDAIAQ